MSRFAGGFHLGNQGRPNPLMGGLGNFGLDSPSQYQSDRTYDSIYNQRSGGDSRRGGERGGQGFDTRDYGHKRLDNRDRDRGGSDRMLPIGALKNRAGHGLLGSPPMERGVPSEKDFGGGPGNIQQQGLVAALQAQQTQELLAALQAQSTLHSQSMQQIHHGLLPTPANIQHMNRTPPGGQRQFDRMRPRQNQHPYQNQNQRQVNQQQQRKRGQYQDAGSYGQSKKRRDERHDNRDNRDNRDRRSSGASKSTSSAKVGVKDKSKGKASSKIKLAEGEVEFNEELLDAVEQLRARKKIDRNVVDEDIDKLSLFSYDGQMYRCDLCKILCRQIKTLRQHLMGKRHTLNVIEARQAGNDVNRDIIDIDLRNDTWLEDNPTAKTILQKQSLCLFEEKQKLEALEKKCPSNFVHYRIDTRKTAMKKDDVIEITSVSEASVHIKEFTSEKHMFGCEFIKAVCGFSCRLCNIFLQSGKDVNDHIQSKVHSSNYQSFIEKNADYENSQLTRNKDLVTRLSQYESKDVILFEVVNEEGSDLKHLGKKYIVPGDKSLVRVSPMMTDWHEKEETKEEKAESEKVEIVEDDSAEKVEEDSAEKVEGEEDIQDPVEETESAIPEVELEDGYQLGEDICEDGEEVGEDVNISEQELVGFEVEEEAEEIDEVVQEDVNSEVIEEGTENAELNGDNVLTEEVKPDETEETEDVESSEPTFKSPKTVRTVRSKPRGRGKGRRTSGTRSTRAAKAEPEPEADANEEESFEVIDEVGDEGEEDEPMDDDKY